MFVYRESSVNNLAGVRQDLVNKQLTVVPFAPNPPVNGIYDDNFIGRTGNPWHTKYQLETKDLVPHAGAFLEFDTLRHAVKEEVVVKLTAQVALSMLKAKDVVAMYLASSARVETNLTLCSLTVITGSAESSEISGGKYILFLTSYET